MSLRIVWVLGMVLATAGVGRARMRCDPADVDQATIVLADDAIRTGCACDGVSRRVYAQCAKDAVTNLIAAATLPARCRAEALRFARESRCGRPGTVVCCRLAAGGEEHHRIAAPAHCVAARGGSACVSSTNSIVDGCDAHGCRAPACGSDIHADDTACPINCRQPACAAAPAGERLLACVDALGGLALASNGATVLAAWSAPTARTFPDIVARRLDATGAPLDHAPIVLSESSQCGDAHQGPVLSSDGSSYGAAWTTVGPIDPVYFYAINARELTAGGELTGASIELAHTVPFGMCTSYTSGPLAIAATAAHRHAVLFNVYTGCFNGPRFQEPAGTLLSLPSGSRTSITQLGFPLPPVDEISTGPAAVAARGTEALIAWPAAFGLPPATPMPVMEGLWVDATGAGTPFDLGNGTPLTTTVVASPARYLVAWSERGTTAGTTATQIRGQRVPPLGAPLDPAAGLLLASTTGAIDHGPVGTFDGSNWLLVWTERTGSTRELRAVAMRDDGTLIDAPSRLLASDVSDDAPAVTSPAPGKVMVLFARAGLGGAKAVHTLLATGP